MKKPTEWTVRNRAIGMMLAVVLPLSLLSAVVDFMLHRNDVLQNIDSQLRVAAIMARATLPANYHDRITDAHSVSKEEFDRIVEHNNALCQELGLEYLWSLMLVDGQPRFTSATSPDKVAKNGLHAKFYELHSNPELYDTVFQTMEIQTQDNVDQWGTIRVVLVPYRDIHGRKYLFGASKKREAIRAFPHYIVHEVLFTSGVFLIPGILIILTITKKMTRPITSLVAAAQEIGAGNYSTPVFIQGAREINILSSQIDAMRISIRDKIVAQQTTLTELREFKHDVDSSPIIFFRVLLSPEFPTEFISENISLLGYSAGQFMNGSISWRQIMPKSDFDRISAIITQALEAEEDSFRYEGRIIPANGETRWYESRNRILKNSEGVPTHLQGILIDISQRRIVEQRDKTYQQRLKALAQELATVEERERHQLAEIIHDDLSQMVAALNMKFSVLKDAGGREPTHSALAQEISELIAHIMSTCKSLTWQASPTSLYESDIVAGLKRMADDLDNLFGLHVQLSPPDNRIDLAPDTAALLFRCARELLVNVAKHSGTLQAEIHIRQINHTIELIVSDNGSGFNPEQLENGSPTGFGLFSIKERLAHIGGSILVESTPGKGTKICILVPSATTPKENSFKA